MLDIHPIVVHFPIVLVVLALFLQILGVVKRLPMKMSDAPLWLMYFAAIAALIGVASGYRATEIIGHDAPGHDLVHKHRNIMLWFTGLLTGGSILHLLVKKVQTPIYRLVLLTCSAVIMIIGAGKGGKLVYEHGIGVMKSETAIEKTSNINDRSHLDDSPHTH